MENIDFISLFACTLNADEGIRMAASQSIETLMKNERPFFITSCMNLLLNSTINNYLIHRQAALYLNMSFVFRNSDEHENILKMWTHKDSTDFRSSVKQCATLLLGYSDEVIREQACQLLSRLFLFDRGQFVDTFNKIFDIIKNATVSIASKLSAIKTVKYMFEIIIQNPKNYNFAGKFKDAFSTMIYYFVQVFLTNPQLYSIELISEIYEALSFMVLNHDEPFMIMDRRVRINPDSDDEFEQNEGNEIEGQIENVIENARKDDGREFLKSFFAITANIVQCKNLLLCRSIHLFLFSLFKVYYTASPNNLPEITNYIISFNFSLIFPYTEISHIAIDFWNEIGRFERKNNRRIKMITKYEEIRESRNISSQIMWREDKPPFHNACGNICNDLLKLILKTMSAYIPQDNSIESFGQGDDGSPSLELHIYAASCIRKLLFFNREVCFNNIRQYFKQVFSINEWHIRHFQMLLIWCICDCESYDPMIFEFIQQITDFMIQNLAVRSFQNPIIAETSLATFSAAFQTYKLFISPEKCLNVLAIVDELCKTALPSIVQLGLQLLVSLISCFERNNVNSGIDLIIPAVVQIIIDTSNRQDFGSSFYERGIYFVKECVIEHVHDSKAEIVTSFMEKSFHNFMNSQNIIVFVGELEVLTAIMQRFGQHFQDKGTIIAKKLVNSLNGLNQSITEECLLGLIKIVSTIGTNAIPMLPLLKEQLSLAFNSQNPSIIISINRVVGSLFITTGPEMADVLVPTVDSIIHLLTNVQNNNSFLMRNQIHFLIFPLAQILKTIPMCIPICEELRDKLFPIFLSLIKFEAADDELENLLLESLLLSFVAVLMISDRQFLIINKLKLFQIVIQVGKLKKRTNGLLYAYCDFMEAAFNKMNTDPVLKMKLHSNENFRALIWAACSNDVLLSNRANHLMDLLKK